MRQIGVARKPILPGRGLALISFQFVAEKRPPGRRQIQAGKSNLQILFPGGDGHGLQRGCTQPVGILPLLVNQDVFDHHWRRIGVGLDFGRVDRNHSGDGGKPQ